MCVKQHVGRERERECIDRRQLLRSAPLRERWTNVCVHTQRRRNEREREKEKDAPRAWLEQGDALFLPVELIAVSYSRIKTRLCHVVNRQIQERSNVMVNFCLFKSIDPYPLDSFLYLSVSPNEDDTSIPIAKSKSFLSKKKAELFFLLFCS